MTYKTKLYLFFIAISSFTAVFAVGVLLYLARDHVFKQIQTNVISIAADAAAVLNGDTVEQIKIREDEQKSAYQEVRSVLRKIRDANRNRNIYAKFVYIIYPNPQNSKKFLFAVDAEEGKDFSHAGDEDSGATADLLYDHLQEPYSYGKMLKDKWGTWLTGYAPIYNSKGEYVATVGVDLSAARVQQVINQILLYGSMAFLLSIIIAVITARILANKASQDLNTLDNATKEIGKGNLAFRVHLTTKDEFEDLAQALNKMCEGLEEKERLKVGFAHYVSQHVMERILKTRGSTKLEGEKRKITVFFSDIRDFTVISEKLPAEQVVSILNEYFKTMLDIVFKHNGMLDKMIGDAIMAEFGFPEEDPKQERNAVITAIEMQRALQLLQDKWQKEGKPKIEIGIGIHTGEAIVGSVGSEETRMEFTAIGDTVNIASRLEDSTRELNERIIVSETTYQALNQEFPAKFLGPLALKGKSATINAYAIYPIEGKF